jgi:quercetin dioxygenase-like cupin family protein
MDKKEKQMYSGINLSRPLKMIKCRFGTLFFLRPRRNPQKPGRVLVVAFDERLPLVKRFKCYYVYYVHFLKQGNIAGNHYHRKKNEIFVPVSGNFKVDLERVRPYSIREHIGLHPYQALHIPHGIAHRVEAVNDNAVLVVLATSPNDEDDEFHFSIHE